MMRKGGRKEEGGRKGWELGSRQQYKEEMPQEQALSVARIDIECMSV